MSEPRIQPATFGERGLRGRLAGLLLRFPALVVSSAVIVLMAAIVGAVFAAVHGSAVIAVGQVAGETRTVRVPVAIEDRAATDALRQAARERAPRVYIMDPRILPELRSALENLPRAVEGVSSVEQLAPRLRDQFLLTDLSLSALHGFASGEASIQWRQRIASLDAALRRMPLVDSQTYQVESITVNEVVELRGIDVIAGGGTGASPSAAGEPIATVPTTAVLPLGSEIANRALRQRCLEAGFGGTILDLIVARLNRITEPTHTFDPQATLVRQDARAAAVEPKFATLQPGQVIFAEGQKVTGDMLEIYRQERLAFAASQGTLQRIVGMAAPAGSGLLIVAAIIAFVRTYAPGLLLRPARLAVYLAIVVGGFVAAVFVSTSEPWLLAASVAGASTLAAMVSAAMYDRRLAFGVGTLVGLGLCLAMKLPVALVAVSLVGVGVVSWLLRDLRLRNTLIKTGAVAGLGSALAAMLYGILDRPFGRLGIDQAIWDAGATGTAVMLGGFVILGVLPWLERALGVTTGLTLTELRDPQHPLLRELQQRAPGTYNHSLTVATLAEAAADAIGADPLLAYVGSLYHDVGKMNKPEYFVENQTVGINRHDRLTPAMSLLVIVSHVRDGVELAREYKLPQRLHHFIEAHHGTTLVEYFFHRAKKRAEAIGDEHAIPLESEYRYPGPKPRTKEVAIAMVCDASESATRSMSDPSAAKIESVVRAIAHKRLMDGQFDECALTLGELHTVVDAIVRALVAMNHQRIAYPEASKPKTIAATVTPAQSQAGLPAAASATVGQSLPTVTAGGLAPAARA